MRNAPHVPELEHNASTDQMHRLRYAFPILDLLLAMNTRRGDVALTFRCYLGCLRNDETGAGPLRIIQGMKLGRHITLCCSTPRKWGHDQSVGKPQLPQLKRLKQIGNGACVLHVHNGTPCWGTMSFAGMSAG